MEEGSYRILGRSSVDILKTGGYKVSALEVEEAIGEHPAVREVAVVGLPDPEWGERIGAAVVLVPGRRSRWRSCAAGRAIGWHRTSCPPGCSPWRGCPATPWAR